MKMKTGLLIIIGLSFISFEMFNFITTLTAFSDILGDLSFLGIPCGFILTVAFCGIEFGGVARILLLGRQYFEQNIENKLLMGAWLLTAAVNAFLTGWGVAVAVSNHHVQGSNFIGREVIIDMIPGFIGLMVIIIRVLMIGFLTSIYNSGEEKFKTAPLPRSARPSVDLGKSISRPVVTPVISMDKPQKSNEGVSHSRFAKFQ